MRSNGPSEQPLPAATEVPAAPPPAHPVPPSVANRLALGSARPQLTGTDARTERLVRGVRGEVEELRAVLSSLRAPAPEMSRADIDAIAADPEGAALLPPALLVEAVVRLQAQNHRLEAKADGLRGRIRKLKEKRAWSEGRLETLEEVIAALHDNLRDLRAERDRAALPAGEPLVPLGAAPRALRGGLAGPEDETMPSRPAAAGDL